MKGNRTLVLKAFLLAILLLGCRRDQTIEEQMDAKTTACYVAISEKDTAWLRIDTAGTQFLGVFELNNVKLKRRHIGQIKGTLSGDTLKGHFDFKVNNMEKWYRNPIAFLRRDHKLIMGVGETTMVWGSPFFNEKKGIDFEKGKFIFEEANCK
jgi:hypothetical protein